MDPEEKQKFADTERARYLEKLRQQSARRQTEKELEVLALQARAEHAQQAAGVYLERIAKRSEFRAHVKKHWHAGHKLHEETLHKVGQFHRERLAWFVQRTLGAAPHHPPPTIVDRSLKENKTDSHGKGDGSIS